MIPPGALPRTPEYLDKGKSGGLFRAGLRCWRGPVGKEGKQAGEAVLPALVAGGAQGGEVVGPVVSVRMGRADGGAEKVKVDAVHGLRPVCGSGFKAAMKHGKIRIRKILGT